MKSSRINAALLTLLLLLFSTSAAYADRLTFRLYLEDVTSGERVVITDNSDLDEDYLNYGANVDNVIEFATNVGNQGFAHGTVAYTDPGNGTSTLILSSSVTKTGAGHLRFILEDIYTTDKSSGSLMSDLIGLPIDEENFEESASGRSVNANFNSYVNVLGAVPDLGVDGAYGGGPLNPALPGGAETTAAWAGGVAFLEPFNAPGTEPETLVGPQHADQSLTFQLPGTYSIFTVIDMQSLIPLTGPNRNRQALLNFTLISSVSTFGNPLQNEDGGGTRIPEPTSLVLLGSGLAALGVVVRKKGRTS